MVSSTRPAKSDFRQGLSQGDEHDFRLCDRAMRISAGDAVQGLHGIQDLRWKNNRQMNFY